MPTSARRWFNGFMLPLVGAGDSARPPEMHRVIVRRGEVTPPYGVLPVVIA